MFEEIILYDIENNPVKVWTFAMVLSHSKYKYGCWQDKPFSAQDFVAAHNKAFQYFGGIPEEVVYDRTKVALVNEFSLNALVGGVEYSLLKVNRFKDSIFNMIKVVFRKNS